MTRKSSSKKVRDLSIPEASATLLRRRQSIRVSFKLTTRCIEAMNILGSHLRLKPKSLFDHMVQEPETLKAIATRAQGQTDADQPQLTKTYVISRDAVEMLDAVASACKVSRDALVETSILHLMPLIQKEQIRPRSRKNLVLRMKRHLNNGRQLLDDMVKDLGENDPMYDKMRAMMATYERAFASLSVFIQRGKNIEGFNVER